MSQYLSVKKLTYKSPPWPNKAKKNTNDTLKNTVNMNIKLLQCCAVLGFILRTHLQMKKYMIKFESIEF